jgi:hypothetical protein
MDLNLFLAKNRMGQNYVSNITPTVLQFGKQLSMNTHNNILFNQYMRGYVLSLGVVITGSYDAKYATVRLINNSGTSQSTAQFVLQTAATYHSRELAAYTPAFENNDQLKLYKMIWSPSTPIYIDGYLSFEIDLPEPTLDTATTVNATFELYTIGSLTDKELSEVK